MEILIERLRLHAAHGVLPQERVVGQDFEVSATLKLDYDGTDSLQSTINYAEACEIITREMSTPSALIEHAAHRIAQGLRCAFPQLRGGRVTVAKLAPPMPYELARVAVTIDIL